jgi:colicin import membrane protein
MADDDRRDLARKKAQTHFTASEARDALVKQEIEKERLAVAAKTAKLRALRLAKEAQDAIDNARLAVEKAEAKAAEKVAKRQAAKDARASAKAAAKA